MRVKLLHLNIFQGKFIDSIVDLVKKEKFDILNFQEVTGGKWSRGGTNKYPDNIEFKNEINVETFNIDCFEELKKRLSYEGILAKNLTFADDKDYMGNATLFNKNLQLQNSKIIWLNAFRKYESFEEFDPAEDPRSAISLEFNLNGKKIYVINTHLAWGPTSEDKPYKLKQAKILIDYIKKLKGPIVFSSDFNLDSSSNVVSSFSSFLRNLSGENKITNTLNLRVHGVKKLFPPGLAVDYIFISPDLKINSFKLIDDIDLSDHFGLSLEFEV